MAVPLSGYAGNWVRAEDQMHYSASLGLYQEIDQSNAGCLTSSAHHTQNFEYGYSYYYTLIAGASLVNKSCGGSSYAGLGDLQLGVRGRLNLFQNGRAWEATVIVPTGYSRLDINRIGYGRYGLELGASGSLYEQEYIPVRKHDFEVGASVRFWEGPPSDELKSYARYIRILSKQRRLYLGLNGDFSLRNGELEATNVPGVYRNTQYDKVSASIGLSQQLPGKWSIYAGLGQEIWGQRIKDGFSFGLTLSRTWKNDE